MSGSGSSGGGDAVGIDVAATAPHLVSLSPPNQLYPLPEAGRVTLGSGSRVDVPVKGNRVEPNHCILENRNGIVTLTPLACNTLVNGFAVEQTVRLEPGSTISIGQSGLFRFNYPFLSNMMKTSVQSNSLGLNHFNGESKKEKVQQSSYNITSVDKYISPKCFPAGSITVNSPADIVLGQNLASSYVSKHNKHLLANDLKERGKTNDNITQRKNEDCSKLNNSIIYQNVNYSYYPNKLNNHGDATDSNLVNGSNQLSENHMPKSNNTSCKDYQSCKTRVLTAPSPSFDRNPSASAQKSSGAYGSSFVYGTIQSKTNFTENSTVSSYQYSPQLSYSYNSCSGSGPCSQYDYDLKFNQQLDEQLSIQAAEKKQLDEILSVFADYERKTQTDQSNKPHHNRIITNGSLPRDKHLCSPSSLSEFSRDGCFSFDPSSPVDEKYSKSSHFDFENKNHLEASDAILKSCDSISSQPNSPRTRIKTTVSKKDVSPSEEHCLEQLETRIASLSEVSSPKYSYSFDSPHFNSSTQNSYHQNDYSNGQSELKMQLDTSSASQIIRESNFRRTNLNVSPSPCCNTDQKPCNTNFKKANVDIMSRSYGGESDTLRNDLNGTNILSRSYSNELLTSSSPYNNLKNSSDNNKNDLLCSFQSDIKKLKDKTIYQNIQDVKYNNQKKSQIQDGFEEEKRKIDSLVYELNKLVNQPGKPATVSNVPSPNKVNNVVSSTKEKNKFILPLDEIDSAITAQRRSLDFDKETLRNERQSMLMDLVTLKSKVLDIRQQENEILREMKMECALLEGEYKSEIALIKAEEENLKGLQEKLIKCEEEIEKCTARQTENKQKLEDEQRSLNELEEQMLISNPEKQPELIQSYKLKQENLEYEKKNFEDMEFLLLEEEAGLLSKREEYQRDLNEATSKLHARKTRVSQLAGQQKLTLSNAADESKLLESLLITHQNNIKEIQNRVRELDIKLGDINHTGSLNRGLAKVAGDSSESDDDLDRQIKQQSMDDINRISKITLGTPIMESNQSNSLGRRTVALLKEIEKNRQLLLAKQGSQVIEEERKRVLELKQRVQTEVHAQWEERKQRENNCLSLNSVGSEESSITSSDVQAESASNEDNRKVPNKPDETNLSKMNDSMIGEELKSKSVSTEEDCASRPWSEASSTVSEDQLSVRFRRNGSHKNIQRPLTRYLPFKSGELLDLRQHIISAGHQVELCQQVTLDSTSCRGYLQKMTARFHNWNKRWFVFDRTARVFSYYSDSSEKKLKGVTYFPAIEEVYVDHLNSVKSPHPNLTFVIKTKDRMYYLMARNPETMRIWVDVIFTGAEGYQEFFNNA